MKTELTCWARQAKMSTLTPPMGTFHSIYFYKTLHTSYWGIVEWIWVLTLVVYPIWKMAIFPLGWLRTQNRGFGVRMLFASKVEAKWHKILMRSKFYDSKNYWWNRNASVLWQKWEWSDTPLWCTQKFIPPKTTTRRGITLKNHFLSKELLGKLLNIIHIKKYISPTIKF
jgi:hypothetical protein